MNEPPPPEPPAEEPPTVLEQIADAYQRDWGWGAR